MKFPIWPGGNGSGDAEIPGIVPENDPALAPSDGNNRKYNRPSARYDSEDWGLGWSDGRLGQPPDTEADLLVARAAVEREEELRKTRTQRAAAQAKALALKNRLDLLADEIEHLRPHHRRLSDRRQRHSSESSLPLASMYLAFGALLFLADVPLSLTLVADGFDIPTWYTIPGTDKTVYVSGIFSEPRLVLYYLWEAMLLALGIALIGIIVKFFVDAVILRDEEEDPPRNRWVVGGITAAFLLFVACTLSLGQFRAGIRAATATKPPVPYETLTFILLTLTFPIAGGFCFSAGWRRLERAKHYYLTSLRLRRLERRQQRAFADYGDASESVANFDQIIGVAGDGLAVSRANLKKNVYLHGYYRGLNVPETRDADESLYGFCEKTLSRMLARKVRRNLLDIK